MPFVVHPLETRLDNASQKDIWIVYPNLAQGEPIVTQPNTESFSGISYPVLQRQEWLNLEMLFSRFSG